MRNLSNERRPEIAGTVPGPIAMKILERDAKWVSQGGARPYRFVIRDGDGSWVRDVDDNVFLDFTSGIGALATGHRHPKIMAAIRDQQDGFMHISSAHHTYDVMVTLAEKVSASVGLEQPSRAFFSNSGTEAIEGATKLARWFTKRPYIISFFGAFHGRTYGAMSVSGLNADQRKQVGPLLPGYFLPYPDAQRGISSDDVLARAKELFQHAVPPSEVAAILVEAIQGGAGPMSIPDEGFLPLLRELADQHGFLLIVDEIYTGVGRTGKMWGFQHSSVKPDIVCFAKSISSGLPLGGFVARHGLMEWPRGSHNSTYGGNPVSCAAALATLDVVDSTLIEDSRKLGNYLLGELEKLALKYRGLFNGVWGKGLMIYAEMDSPRHAQQMLTGAFENGLLLLAGGQQGFRLAPPLIIDSHEAEVGIEIIDRVLEKI
jgi:4-aminobutyrate aminotransferase